jgi:hypothetical protein
VVSTTDGPLELHLDRRYGLFDHGALAAQITRIARDPSVPSVSLHQDGVFWSTVWAISVALVGLLSLALALPRPVRFVFDRAAGTVSLHVPRWRLTRTPGEVSALADVEDVGTTQGTAPDDTRFEVRLRGGARLSRWVREPAEALQPAVAAAKAFLAAKG